VQDRHAPPESGVLAKAASGALDAVPIATVVNIARTLEQLGEREFWRVALAGDGDQSLREAVTTEMWRWFSVRKDRAFAGSCASVAIQVRSSPSIRRRRV
jgi:hypothetical protein